VHCIVVVCRDNSHLPCRAQLTAFDGLYADHRTGGGGIIVQKSPGPTPPMFPCGETSGTPTKPEGVWLFPIPQTKPLCIPRLRLLPVAANLTGFEFAGCTCGHRLLYNAAAIIVPVGHFSTRLSRSCFNQRFRSAIRSSSSRYSFAWYSISFKRRSRLDAIQSLGDCSVYCSLG